MKYIVSIVGTQNIEKGVSIVHNVQVVTVDSKEDAFGLAIIEFDKLNPNHSIFKTPSLYLLTNLPAMVAGVWWLRRRLLF